MTTMKKRLRRGLTAVPEWCQEQARSLSPDSAVNYQLLSVIHLREKKYRSLQDIDMYLELGPDSTAGQRARIVREWVVEKSRGNKRSSGFRRKARIRARITR
jgi:hypothetical protein